MPETAPGAFAPSASHVSGPQWQSFELRMRQRRAARLAARAQAALEEGQVAEAEEALQEARTLDSSAPDLKTLRARIGVSARPVAEPQPAAVASEATLVAPETLSRELALSAAEPAARTAKPPVVASRQAVVGAKPVVIVAKPPVVAAKPSVVAPLVAVVAPEPVTRTTVAPAWEPDFLRDPDTIPVVGNRGASRGIRVAGAAAASLLLVTSFALWNGRAWRPEFARREAPNMPTPPQPVAPQPVAATAGQITVPPPAASDSAAAPAIASSPVDTGTATQLSVPAPSVPPARAPESDPEPDQPAGPPPPVTAVQPIATAQPITTVQTLRDEPVNEPQARDGIESALPVTAPPPTPPVVTPPEPPPAPERVDETPFVRQVLSQYAAAYSSLDASAARRVWPSLDTGALSRAFAGLESQRVSLGTCSITFSATSARADCRGSAEWTPRVGGGSRSAARRWSFDLRKTGGQWRIVDAIVQ